MWVKVIPSGRMRGAKALRQRRDYVFQSVGSSPGFSHVSSTRSWVPSAEGLCPSPCEVLPLQLSLWGGGEGGEKACLESRKEKGDG